MFWDYFSCFIVFIIGIINIVWPNETAKITWAVRRGVDDKGKKEMANAMRFIGVIIVVVCFFWFRKLLNS